MSSIRGFLCHPNLYSGLLVASYASVQIVMWILIAKLYRFYKRQTDENSQLLVQTLMPMMQGNHRATEILVQRVSMSHLQDAPNGVILGMMMMIGGSLTSLSLYDLLLDTSTQMAQKTATKMELVIAGYKMRLEAYLTREWLYQEVETSELVSLILSYL